MTVDFHIETLTTFRKIQVHCLKVDFNLVIKVGFVLEDYYFACKWGNGIF